MIWNIFYIVRCIATTESLSDVITYSVTIYHEDCFILWDMHFVYNLKLREDVLHHISNYWATIDHLFPNATKIALKRKRLWTCVLNKYICSEMGQFRIICSQLCFFVDEIPYFITIFLINRYTPMASIRSLALFSYTSSVRLWHCVLKT